MDNNYVDYFEKKDYQLLFASFTEHLKQMKESGNLEYSSFMKDFSAIFYKMRGNPEENYQSFITEFEKFLPNLEKINFFQYWKTDEIKFLSFLAEKYDSQKIYQYLLSSNLGLIDALSSLTLPSKKEFIKTYLENVNLHCPEKVDLLWTQPIHSSYSKLINDIHQDDDLFKLAYSRKFTLNWNIFALDISAGFSMQRCKDIVASDPNSTHRQFMAFFDEHNNQASWIQRLTSMHSILHECKDLFTQEQQKTHTQKFREFFNLILSKDVKGIFRDCDFYNAYKESFILVKDYMNTELNGISFGNQPLFHYLMDNSLIPYKTHYNPTTGKEENLTEQNKYHVRATYFDAHYIRALKAYLSVNKNVPLPNLMGSKGIAISPLESFIHAFNNMNRDYSRLNGGNEASIKVNTFDFLIQSMVRNNTSFFKQDNVLLYETIRLLPSKSDREYVRNFINHNLEELKENTINWYQGITPIKNQEKKTSAFKKLFSFWSNSNSEKETIVEENVKHSEEPTVNESYQKMNAILEKGLVDEKVKHQVQEFFKNSQAILTLCEQLPTQFIEEKINVQNMNQKYIFDIVNNYQEGIKIIQNKEKFTESTLSQIQILNEEIVSISVRVQNAIDTDFQQKSDELGQFLQKRYKSNSMS
jgi:hypothetical protein